MKHLVTIAILTGTIAVSGTAFAQRGQNKFMRFFDNDKDGNVTMQEFDKAAKSRYQRMDKNSDGKMTDDEFKAYLSERRSERRNKKFQKMDANKDGFVSKDEYIAYQTNKAEKRFSRMDADGNGMLTQEENNKRGKRRHRGGSKMFKKLDTNNDGIVTQKESYDAWSNWFGRIDADGDKTVTKKEVRGYRNKKRREK